MATINANPFADFLVPAAYTSLGYSGGSLGIGGVVAGLCAYTEGASRQGTAYGASTQRGRHVLAVTDFSGTSGGTNDGRRMQLMTLGDSGLTGSQLNVDTVLAGSAGGDLPDFAVMQGFIGMVDGVGRSATGSSLAGIRTITEENPANVGITAGYNDATASITAVNGGLGLFGSVSGIGQYLLGGWNGAGGGSVVNNAFLLAYTQRFNSVVFTLSTPGVGTYTITWEYWNGTAWTALSGVTDGTSGMTATGTLLFTMPAGGIWRAGGKLGDASTSVPNLYWIRGRVSAYTSMTTLPIASAVQIAEAAVFGGTAVFDNNRGVTSYHLGFPVTCSSVDLNVTTAGVYATGSFEWQYWNGTAWTALSGVTDNSTNLTLAGVRRVSFTVPGDWALLDLHEAAPGGSSDGTGRRYWIRLAATTYSETTQPVVTALTAVMVTGTVMGMACLSIGDDPVTNAPSVIPWGIALPAGVNALATGLYTFWDPIRRIRSRRFDLSAHPSGLSHSQTHLKIAKWSGTTSTATLAAVIEPGTNAENTGAADTTILIGKDAGPPIPSDETLPADKRITTTGFTTCTVHRTRVYVAGARGYDTTLTGKRVAKANMLLWSEPNDFHHFPRENTLEIAANDGDEIIAIRSFRDHLIIFKRTKAYLLVGEPGTGAAGLSVVQLSDNIGCVAKRTAVSTGNQLYWLSERGVMRWDGAANIEAQPVSQPIRRIIEGLTTTAIHLACAVYEPSKKMYYLAATGIQAQSAGAAGPGQTLNDGLLVYAEQTNCWDVWLGIFAASLAMVARSTNTHEVAIGTYWGDIDNVRSIPDGFVPNDGAGSVTPLTGTLTGATGTTCSDTAATWPNSNTDHSMLGRTFMVKNQTTGVIQARRIIGSESSPDRVTVSPAWTSTPTSGDTYYIGPVYAHFETGDLVLLDGTADKTADAVRVLVDRPLATNNSVDLATDPTPVSATGTGLVYAAGTLSGDVVPQPLFPLHKLGRTIRYRFVMMVLASTAASRITRIILTLRQFLRKGML